MANNSFVSSRTIDENAAKLEFISPTLVDVPPVAGLQLIHSFLSAATRSGRETESVFCNSLRVARFCKFSKVRSARSTHSLVAMLLQSLIHYLLQMTHSKTVWGGAPTTVSALKFKKCFFSSPIYRCWQKDACFGNRTSI